MKAPVLVVGPRAIARQVGLALHPHFALTLEEDTLRARALAGTGAHLAVLVVGGSQIEGAVEVDASADAPVLVAAVTDAIARTVASMQDRARADDVGVLEYDDYRVLVRYATTRRYLTSLLEKHQGSVTDAARGAGLKRESLHRLLRRHHINAERFRPR